jgi:hypothetical protein
MNTLLKALIAAAGLLAGANSVTMASAEKGLMSSCEASSFTPHGVWYCR